MPITFETKGQALLLPSVGQLPAEETVDDEAKEGPGVGETFGAAFRLENTVMSTVAALRDGATSSEPIDPDFDFAAAIPEGNELQASKYAFVNNQREADGVTRQIAREMRDRQIIEEAGVLGVASMFVAAGIDPVNLIPVGGTAYKTYRLGGSVFRGAMNTAKAGLLSSTAAESVLQATQTQRTFGEGAINIAAGTFLSGVLGGSGGALRSLRASGKAGRAAETAADIANVRASPDAAAKLEADMIVPAPDAPDPIMPYQIVQTAEDLAIDTGEALGGSVGAAATRSTSIAEESIKSALGLEKVVKFQDPLLSTATSPSIETRRVSQRLAEQVLTYEKNALDIETPLAVETRIAAHQAGLSNASVAMDEQFILYRKGRKKQFGDVPRIAVSDIGGAARRAEKLTYQEFKNEIGLAMQNSDTHPIAEVAAAAKKYRAEVFDPLKDEAVKLGLLDEDVAVETAPSYLMRVYNVERIIAERPQFKGVVKQWLQEQRDLQAERAPLLQGELDRVGFELTGILRQAGALKRGQVKAERLLSEKRIKLERDVVAGNKTVRRAESDLNKEAMRLADAKPSDQLKSDDPLKEFIRTARKGFKEPEGLVDWVRKTGGVADFEGDVAALNAGTTPRGKRKLIVEGGRPLDDLTLEAWEEGFFPLHQERPDINDMLDAMGDDLRGNRVIREEDLDQMAMIEELDGFQRITDELGIDFSKSDSEIAFAMRNAVKNSEEIFEPGSAKFKAATPARRAKAREVARRVAQLEKRLTSDEDVIVALREVLADAVDNLKDVKSIRGVVRDALKELKKGAAATQRTKKTLRKEQRKAAFKGEFDNMELSDIADQIIDRILGTPDGRLPYDINPDKSKGGVKKGVGGPLKKRKFLIPDERISAWLETDVEHIARVYTRSMSSDVELVREFGDVDMTIEIDNIRGDYAKKAGAEGLTAKQLTKLNSRKDRDIRDIAGMRDRIRGIYAFPKDPTSVLVRSGRVIRTMNYLRLLGGMTASAFPDPFRVVMVHGVSRTLGDGVVPLIKGFKSFRLSAGESKLSGTGLDMVLDTRTMMIADVMDDFGRFSKFERGVKGLQDKFGLVSLMAPWNAFWKQFAGMVTMSRMLKASKAIAEGQGSAKEIEKLNAQGINSGQAARIWGFFKQHGEIVDGVFLPNTLAWEGPGAAEAVTAFRGGLKKEVDKIIVTPGQDKPLWMSTEWGKVIGQFKSFSVASVQRTALTGLQQRDMAALNGALLSVVAGMAVYGFKQSDAGRELSDDPKVWITEGLDRSGMFGWFWEVNNLIEKATRGAVGVNALIGGPPMSRFASRNVLGAVLGPSVGAVQDLATVTGDLAQQDWKAQDTRALRRLIPYQNLIGMRRVWDEAEAGINDALGVKK